MENTDQTYTNLKKVSSKNGEIEFKAEISTTVLEEAMLGILAHYAEDFSMPGFRKGKVPHNVVREHIGEMELLEDAANETIRVAMQEIAEDEKIDVLGRPQVTLTKIAPKNPLEFTVRYALTPDISLPDYKKIGKTIFERKDSTDVTEQEIDEAIERIRTMLGEKPPFVPLTEETIKKFGDFKTLADFREEIKKQLGHEKELHMKDGRREEIIKEIVKESKLKLPELLIEQELNEFLIDRDRQLTAAGLSLDEYLKQIKKTAEELEKEERRLIEEDLRMSLVVQAIRRKEAITADDRDIHASMAQLKLRYPERTEDTLHRTAEAMIIQDKLFTILEGAEPSATAATPSA